MTYKPGDGGSQAIAATARRGRGGSTLYAASRKFLSQTAEAPGLHLRMRHNMYDTKGAEAVPLHIIWQYQGIQYVYDDQETRFLLGNFVLDNQETRFIIAELVTDDQGVRFIIGNFVDDDQETRFILGNFVTDDQGTRFVLANFLTDNQEVRFVIALIGGAEQTQEVRFLLANYVPKTPMALYWCDTGSGETLVDDTPYGRDGTFKGVGEPAWNSTGREGSPCLVFDGNDYVDLPASINFGDGGDWTVELWGSRSVLTGPSHVLLSQKDGSGTGRIVLGMVKLGVNYYWATQVFGGTVILGWPATSLAVWQHAAVRYRASDGLLSLMVDGNIVFEQSEIRSSLSNDGALVLGAYKDYSLGYKGKLDSVRISNYRRSDAQLVAAAADAEVAEPDTRFQIGEFVADDQEARFIIAEFVADDQDVRFILANFYRRDCGLYFYIEGTGVVVFEPAEGYVLDDSYIAQRTKVGKLLEVRFEIAPWPTTPVVATQDVRFTIAASGVGELPAHPTDPTYMLPGSKWYLLGMPLDPGSYKVHDHLCDDFGHVTNQYYVGKWHAVSQAYLPLVAPKVDCLTSAVALGEGFWALLPSTQFELLGAPVTGEKSVALVAGWNLVATPYDIRMDNILVEYAGATQPLNYSADKVLGIFYASMSGSGGYTTVDVSVPDTIVRNWGYWVKALVPCNLIFREGLT